MVSVVVVNVSVLNVKRQTTNVVKKQLAELEMMVFQPQDVRYKIGGAAVVIDVHHISATLILTNAKTKINALN
jgi:hypothetical protein